MSSDTFVALTDRIYEQLYNNLERRDEIDFRFATSGTAKRVLHNEFLIRLFQCLPIAGFTVSQQFGLGESELAARVDSRGLHDFLAVLIFASCGIEAARTFTAKLVSSNEWPLRNEYGKCIQALPATRKDLLSLFDDDSIIVDKFCKTQACFSTVTIMKRKEVIVESLQLQRLPYLEETECGSGSFGKVFKVKIATGHFKDTKKGTLNDAPKELARKDYLTSDKFGEEERRIIETIFNASTRKCENILGNYGSLRIGPTTYSLFMPWARCDLRAYMAEIHTTKPSTLLERAEIVLSARGLAEGLDFLHNEMRTPDQKHMVCYHMDLKPSNILVFLEEAYGGGTRYVWKLSDFGMARVKTPKSGQMVERNFDRSFLHRREPEPEPSGTINRRGEGTYLAPESLKKMPTMTRSSDVWSLGCVLSVVFAYLEEGGEGVNKYQNRRLDHPDSDGYDRFFQRRHSFLPNKVHPEVHKWHTRLIEKAALRQDEEGYAVEYMLRYLEKRVLVIDDEKRDGVRSIKEKLSETYTLLKQMPLAEKSGVELKNCHHNWINRITQMNHKKTPHSDEQIASWQLSGVEGLKGCEISPQGTLVAYWSDVTIKLYNELSLPSKMGSGAPQIIQPAAEYGLKLADFIWKSVVLSEKYLIASTSAASFQCYIYETRRLTPYPINLQLPGIRNLAISPDSKMLACVIQGKEEGQDRASVLIVPIMDLIQYGSPREPDCTTLELDWSAVDITHISFPTPDEVYLVVQPQITAKSRDNEIPIIHLSLGTRPRLMQTVIIQSQGVDPGNVAGLFTAFTAFRQQPATCAFISRQKHLHIQDLQKPRTNDVQHLIKSYRILKLVMDCDDRKMFALGTHLGKSQVYLLELTVPQSETGKVPVRELAVLPGLSQDDEFTLVLSYNPQQPSEGGEKYILIAALATTSPRWVYRIPLEDSSIG